MIIKSLSRSLLDERSRRQYKNIVLSFLFKGISMGTTFALVPLCLLYLSKESYGIWLTISSIVGWTTLFDLGLGSGLKNKLSEYLSTENPVAAQSVVSTAYFLLGLIVIGILIAYGAISVFVDWNSLLKVSKEQVNLNLLASVCFVLFTLRLLFDLINSVLHALQKVAYSNWIITLSNIATLIVVYFLYKFHNNTTENEKLYRLGLTVTTTPIIVLIVANLYLFRSAFPNLMPRFRLFNMDYIDNIWSLGWRFFIIQISALVIFSTDNLIISRLFDLAQVTIYNIAFKLFSVFLIVWSIIITPYWTAFNEAHTKSDFVWIRKTLKLILFAWAGLCAGIIATLPLSPYIYKLWINSQVTIPFDLSVWMAVFIIITTYCGGISCFINGIGKIQLQVLTSLTSAFINIPLAIFLAKYMNMGISGIMAATCISLLIGAITCSIQAYKLLNNTATGIWNK